MLKAEVQLRREGGNLDMITSILIDEGTTVIMRADPSPLKQNKKIKRDAVYVVLTPELVR